MKTRLALLIGLSLIVAATVAPAKTALHAEPVPALVKTTATNQTVAGLPLHIQKLDDRAIRLWIGDHISSTAIVAFATDEGLVIIDTLGWPEVDQELRRVIARELGRDDFKYLINTHEHGDHTGGNIVYADCEIIGHELVAENMVRSAEDRERISEWMTTRIAEQEQELAQLASDAPEAARLKEELTRNRIGLKNVQANEPPVPPTKTFSDRLVLDCGDTTFEMYYIGGMHSNSDIAIFVPEHRILMTGDTMADVWLTDTPGCLASFGARNGIQHDFQKQLKNWNHLLTQKDQIDHYLPGHWNGELSYEGFAARVKYIETLWNDAPEVYASGQGMDYMLTEYALSKRFPELVDSPGCDGRSNYGTIVEIWRESTGQKSAAQELARLIEENAGETAIAEVLAERDAKQPDYFFVEAEINGYGYMYLQREMPEQAAELFAINVELYPESWNVYDSYGEALLATGDQEQAIAMYEKSIEMNPENENGIRMLEQIRSGASAN